MWGGTVAVQCSENILHAALQKTATVTWFYRQLENNQILNQYQNVVWVPIGSTQYRDSWFVSQFAIPIIAIHMKQLLLYLSFE